ncbi:MAG: ytxJ [Bacteroidota bacterium]|nr:ytxJ [Bacteroidota bacterium]
MKWETLDSEQQFLNLLETESVFAVFKHSTRCAVSSMAKNRLEREWDLDLPIYYLDLVRYRSVSNLIAERSHVIHESPQLIVYKNGKQIYNSSHSTISVTDVKEELHEHAAKK